MTILKGVLVGAALLIGSTLVGQDWPTQNYDLAGTRFSPLKQINTTNVSRLKQVWTFKLRTDDKTPFQASEAVPIVVKV